MFLSKGRFGIKLVPLGKVPVEVLEYLLETIQEVFRKKAFLSDTMEIPVFAYDLKRSQYNAKELINFLYARKKYKEKTLGIINEDIYLSDSSYIFGVSSASKEVSVISMWRFDQNRIHSNSDPMIFVQRLKKTAIRQVATIFGLRHCDDPECVMYKSTTIEEIDAKSDRLCKQCRSKI